MNLGKEFIDYATKHKGISGESLSNITSSMTPYIMEERSMNITQMDVFSRLMMDRIIFLGTAINDQVANVVVAQLLFLESVDKNATINMYINSPGGSVYAGLGIYDTMQFIKSPVHTICTGLAASMGAILLAGGEAGKRSALKHSRIMIHQPLGETGGQATDMEITVNEIKKLKKELYDILVHHTGQKFNKIEKDSDRDCWMRSIEAKEYGLIDNVYTK